MTNSAFGPAPEAGGIMRPFHRKAITQMLLVMKLTVLLLTVAIFSAHANSAAQTVTLTGEKIPVKQLFTAIEQQTGYVVFYNEKLMEHIAPISIDAHNMPLEELLDKVFKDLPLEYVIEDKTIVISRKRTVITIQRWLVHPITGIVRSADGKPLAGASIRIKGTAKGSITDEHGRFSISAEKGQTLIVSFTGYDQQEIEIEQDKAVEVTLRLKKSEMETVVINGGYYKTKEKFKTGSISRVTGKELERQPLASPILALQGRVPGLDISPTTGVPGSAVRIQIRGRNSLRDNSREEVANSPLYVIDGIPIDPTPLRSGSDNSTTTYNGYDPLSGINPANIESIEVLKDADATAIYGSRGANGVILITTRQGTDAGKIKAVLDVYQGAGSIMRKMDMMNTQQYLEMRREALANDGTTPQANDYDINGTWDTTRYTNWQDELLGGTAKITHAQLGLSGGNKNSSFRFSTGYHKEGTIYGRDFGFHRYDGNANISHRTPDGKFSMQLAVNYGITQNKTFEGSFMTQAITLAPNAPKLYNEDGSLNWQIIYPLNANPRNTFDNPHAILLNTNASNSGTFLASLNLSYGILPELSLKASIGYNDQNSEEVIKKPIAAISPTNISQYTAGYAAFGMNRRRSLIAEPQLVYEKQLKHHTLDLVAGATWQQGLSQAHVIGASGYSSDLMLNSMRAASSVMFITEIDNRSKYMSFYARAGYNWKERYILNLTVRRDGSSRFASGNRFGNFGSIGAAWIFSDEHFMAGAKKILSFGKFRGSYGITGNDQIGDYKFMDLYEIAQAESNYQGSATLFPTALYNPDFRWEETRKLDAAIEIGLLNDRLFLEVDWYRNRSGNQLQNYDLPPVTGFDAVFVNFPAVVENRGLEAVIRANCIRTTALDWTVSFNIARNQNELIAFPNLESSPYASSYKVGMPLSVRNMFTYIGIDPQTGLYTFADLDNDGAPGNGDMEPKQPTDRLFYGGMTSILRYKLLELSLTFQYSKQNREGYRPSKTPGATNFNMPVSYLARWRKPGDQVAYPKYSRSGNASINSYYYSISDGCFTDASFIRLKTLSLSCNLPDTWVSNIRLKQVQLFGHAQNLLTFTKFRGLDPETAGPISVPPLRMVTGGIRIQL